MSFISWLKAEGSKIHSLFVSHEAALETISTDLGETAKAAAAIAAAAGEKGAVPILAGIADGSARITAAIQAGATAADAAQGVGVITALAGGLVSSGDLQIKDAATQNAVSLTLTKVTNIANVAQSAIDSASPVA